ncbi:NCS1 nucleoside transporter family [Hygrophoropsis aurantiaca]|uniref:NCS1 nucleoside transporter family n=1 Tax=Hygrophoropsis aurantiaca TaxID=72124 RepID=A0ACB8AHT0_9AGAM|nr:NCS1 nucleoside transporter family [Hygrophoropsis aurantiaca]
MSDGGNLKISLEVPGHATPYLNDDILPLPLNRRTWTKSVFAFFWFATAINIAEWSGASASLGLGLTVPQAIIVNMISTIIITIALVISGFGGGQWHVPFSVLNRTAWGIRGSWFPLMNRILLSCCWYGVQGWYGGQLIKVMIGSIWPSFYSMKNTFGPGAAMQTNEFGNTDGMYVAFIIFWVISLPFFLLRPESYRLPAIISSIIVSITAVGIFIWALVKQGNGGPLFSEPEAISGVGKLQGVQLAWIMVKCINSGIGGWAGGILYQSDFSRYAVRPGDQVYGQIFVIPLCLLGSNILGIVTTSCARGFYPNEPLLWKLYDLLEAIQMNEGPAARAGVFFAAFAFLISQLCVNIVACGIVGGMDLAALFPKYLNIRRGSFIIAIIGICINPWKILNTANSFISAISGYAVFLGPLTGIMLADYHILRRRRVKLSHMFLPNDRSDYWFWHGLNWRAPIAWLLGVWPSLPGFCASVTPANVVVGDTWMRVSYLSWPLSFCISAFVWMILNTIWPPRGVGEIDDTDISGTFGSIGNEKNDQENEESCEEDQIA